MLEDMPESAAFWDLYWEMRLADMETLGKREAILSVSRLIRTPSEDPRQPVRLLELGCGEAQILGALVEGHAQVRDIHQSVGVDYLPSSIATCRRNYPMIRFIMGDFTDPALLSQLGQFEILLFVNALHEVFSREISPVTDEVDIPAAKQKVVQALALAVEHIAPGGYLALFDGLEQPGDINRPVRVRFVDRQARKNFETFAREYRPFHITYRETGSQHSVELSRRDFTRYITKSIFLGKRLWQSERFESYQYFNEDEFRSAIQGQGLVIREVRKLTMNDEKWSRMIEIETPGEDFPIEHILFFAQKA